jgi:hypothetical protein
VELCALVDVDDSIGGRFPMPDGIVQEALDSVQDNLKGKKNINLYQSTILTPYMPPSHLSVYINDIDNEV